MTDQIAADPKEDTSDAYAYVGREMRRLRLTRGLTQAQAARVIDVSPQQYQKYEEAHSKCSLNYLIALADYYAVDVNVFLPRNPTAAPQEPAARSNDMASEADLLARLVSAFVQLSDPNEKLRLVQLVEAIGTAKAKSLAGGAS